MTGKIVDDGGNLLSIPEVLMLAGQVVEGIRTSDVSDDWSAWATNVVRSMGQLIHSYDQEHVTYGRLLESAERAEFLLAVAAACAERGPGGKLYAVEQVLSMEATARRRLEEKVEGLEADLFSAVEVAFKRGAVEWTEANYPAWHKHLTAGGVA